MPLQIIGVGLPRTATNSLCEALKILGLRTHHMKELAMNAPLLEKWDRRVMPQPGQKQPDWHEIFEGYDATVDFPSALFWEDIAKAFPDAKLVLTDREPGGWVTSFIGLEWFCKWFGLVFGPLKFVGFDRFDRFGSKFVPVLHTIFFYGAWAGPKFPQYPTHPSPAEMEAKYVSWVKHVKATAPADRILHFRPQQGWKPLCDFLEMPVPSEPFPCTNAGVKGLCIVAFEIYLKKPFCKLFGLTEKED